MADGTAGPGRPDTVARIPQQRLRELAQSGELAGVVTSAPVEVVAELRADAFAFAYPLVYERHTRRLERSKRHVRCATSVENLRADCYDGFTDDVFATVDYLLRYAKQPIHNLEGWIVSRLGTATVDGHRRRRGEVGALQRPRVPRWLAARLGGDPWLVELAARIIDWVGVRTTAGLSTWPTATWAELRAERTGRWQDSTAAEVAREVAVVLDAMAAGDAAWYQQHIEVPLGTKHPPVVDAASVASHGEPSADVYGARIDTADERAEALLFELAELALERLQERLAAGAELEPAVVDVVTAVFVDPASTVIDLTDGAHDTRTDYLTTALRDAGVVRRVSDAVLEILRLDA